MDNLEKYIDLFENLSPDRIKACENFVSSEMIFIDPFNHITNRKNFEKLLYKTLQDVEKPCFTVTVKNINGQKHEAILKWQFTGKIKQLGDIDIHGFSEIHWNKHEKIIRHIDFWDSGLHFDLKIPLIGRILKYIRSKASV